MVRSQGVLRQTRLLLFLAAAAAGCGTNVPPVAETPPPPVSVSSPIVREVVEQDEYEGRIAAAQTVEVRARVRGHLTKVAFQPGEIVKEGELLYEIDPRTYEAQLEGAQAQEKAAQADLQYSKAEYNRTRLLVSKNAASREELDTWTGKQAVAEGQVLKAQAAVKQAQLDLDFTKIKAPFAGRVSRTQVDVGNLVNAGGGETLLTTLVSVDPMFVYFPVDERAFLRYRKSGLADLKPNEPEPPIKDLHIPVQVALESDQGFPHKGEIDFADNRVNPSTGTILVRGVLSNAKRVLEDGLRARVRVPSSHSSKSVLLITERAVGTDQGQKFVYVVGADNVALRRDIEPGRLSEGLLVVREGLKPDDRVIVNGILRVRDSLKVEPRLVPMPGAESLAAAPKPTGK
jgi:multidrug efflux system membrane fusion protein